MSKPPMAPEEARFKALQIACRGKWNYGAQDIINRAEMYADFILNGKKKD